MTTLRTASSMVSGVTAIQIDREWTPIVRYSSWRTGAGTREDVVDAAYVRIPHEGAINSALDAAASSFGMEP